MLSSYLYEVHLVHSTDRSVEGVGDFVLYQRSDTDIAAARYMSLYNCVINVEFLWQGCLLTKPLSSLVLYRFAHSKPLLINGLFELFNKKATKTNQL